MQMNTSNWKQVCFMHNIPRKLIKPFVICDMCTVHVQHVTALQYIFIYAYITTKA